MLGLLTLEFMMVSMVILIFIMLPFVTLMQRCGWIFTI